MTPDAILFDAGGTLVLQHPDRMAAILGFPIDAGAAFEAHYRTIVEFSTLRASGEHATWDWFLERYFDRLGHPAPVEAGPVIDRGRGLWTLAIPGTIEALERLNRAGVRMGVVSNSDGSVEESLREAGLIRFFEIVIDSAVVGSAKPESRIFLMACERMGLDPAGTWYVGDSRFHDVDGALGAGFDRSWLVDPLGIQPGPYSIESVGSLAERVIGAAAE
ncbi:MAG: HAD family hydrolase [Acidimicrobiia bacterium]|nr:HAD family hydrolase [Acidimicrobiia bacterium]MDH4306942.1 HAD family hydrolase [Acidimicrobiia bacterium]